MNNTVTLVKGELFKIRYQKLIYSLIIIIPVIILISAVSMNYIYDDNEEWRDNLQKQNNVMKKEKKDLELMKINSERKIINNYRLKNNIKPVEKHSISGLFQFIMPVFLIIKLYLIIFSSTIVSREFRDGTIKLLVTKPFSRLNIILSKYLTIIILCITVTIYFSFIALCIGAIFYGFDNFRQIDIALVQGRIKELDYNKYIFLRYSAYLIEAVAFSTVAFTISSIFLNSTIATSISLLLIIIGDSISSLILMKYQWAKYLFFSNTNLSQYIIGDPLIKGTTINFSILMLVLYCLLLLIIAILIFKKRDIIS